MTDPDNEVTVYSNRSIQIMEAILYRVRPRAMGVTAENGMTVLRFVNSGEALACAYIPTGITPELYNGVWRTVMKHLHRNSKE